MKTVYYITDQYGIRWSHNRWGTTESIPDFYYSKRGAKAQIEKGKIAVMMRFDENLKPQIYKAQIQFEETP